MTINAGVGGQAPNAQKYRYGGVMHHNDDNIHKDWIRLRQ